MRVSLSPSTAKTWTRCHGSVDMRNKVKTEKSEAQVRGTVADKLLEVRVRRLDNCVSPRVEGDDEAEEEALKELGVEDIQAVDVAMQYLAKREEEVGPLMIWTQHKIQILADQVGYVDLILWAPLEGMLETIDYKHGAGRPVFPEENEQLTMGDVFFKGIDRTLIQQHVHTIIQPNYHGHKEPVLTTEVPKDKLIEQKTRILANMLEIRTGSREFVPGEAQCLSCSGKPVCVPLAEHVLTPLGVDFRGMEETAESGVIGSGAEEISTQDAASVLTLTPLIRGFLTAVDRHANLSAKAGATYPGMKLVKTNSRKSWRLSDPETLDMLKTLETVDGTFVDIDMLATVKPLTPTQATRWFANKLNDKSRKFLEDSIVTRPGGVKLVPDIASEDEVVIDVMRVFDDLTSNSGE